MEISLFIVIAIHYFLEMNHQETFILFVVDDIQLWLHIKREI